MILHVYVIAVRSFNESLAWGTNVFDFQEHRAHKVEEIRWILFLFRLTMTKNLNLETAECYEGKGNI